MIVVAVIITAYAALGGLGSIIYNDLIQAVIMCFALIVLPIIAWVHVFQNGGLGECLSAAGLREALDMNQIYRILEEGIDE